MRSGLEGGGRLEVGSRRRGDCQSGNQFPTGKERERERERGEREGE